ncbi:MAG TPA: NAD-dependent epimerase/dehydratase family protein, partial [Trueperaceae bacterium]|nr:NAD-dependent epimerase/dehydratase family protein [Trueperaceae bacterium]
GFIGSHLVERLIAAGLQVNVLDDLSSGRLGNLTTVADRITLFTGDVADPVAVEQAMRGCQAVVHLAAVASVEASVREPLRTNRTNLVGTITVLEAAAMAGARRVVYASSAAVYGEADELPIAEDAAKRPMSPYAVDKLAGEHYLAHYHRQGRLDGTAFRFFNVYGPRQDPGSPYSGVISVFLERVARGAGVTIHGDGRQTRDFVYVADVVEAVHKVLTATPPAAVLEPDAATPSDLAVMNLGRGASTDLLSLLADVAAVCGREGQLEVRHDARREGDIAHSRADIARLRSRFDWVPSTSLRGGLEATLATGQASLSTSRRD